MLFSTFRSLARWRDNFAMRLKWRDYPPLLTHGVAFLAGTLVLPVPSQIQTPPHTFLLYPLESRWQEPFNDKTLTGKESFVLVSEDKSCLLIEKTFGLWRSFGTPARHYLLIDKKMHELSQVMKILRSKKLKIEKSDRELSLCERTQAEVSYDP